FKWFDQSANQEITFVPPPGTQAMDDDPVAPTHSGFGAGFYALRSFTDGVQAINQLPQEFKIGQNFPNPFNAATVIPLELPQRSQIRIELYNVRGQALGLIYQGVQNSGWPKIRYDASRLPSGVYFYRVQAEGLERGGKIQSIGKMLVLK
ncbi:MAG TPA: T9SS type A sorting domain-containing protein, partial [bacterium]